MIQNRSTLKQFFRKGAIPTDSNFADLIDSMLNQEDDSVSKLPNDALKIVATGTDEALLNFYRQDQNEAKLSWQVKQKPGGKAGLSFGDGTNNRLFIDSSSGNVGIGTITPAAKLDVSGGGNLAGPLSIGDILTVKGTGNSSFAGRVGIGTTAPRTALDVGSGLLSGAPNDYIKAQFTMSGGGTVTWGGPGGRLKWTKRFIAISVGGPAPLLHGHMNIVQPSSDIPAAQVYDGQARSATPDGVLLSAWEALYAVHTVGGDENAVTFQVVRYTNDFVAPSNWLLVAVVNDDDKTVRLGTGLILSKNSSSSQGSSIPRGVIMMWSGTADTVPDGWALCDGSNNIAPNLADKFIVGTGKSYAVGATGGQDTVKLTPAQMPSHNHNNGAYTALLYRRPDGLWTTGSTDTTVGEPDIVHSMDIIPAGGDQAHENRPPYYALAYIMKL